MPTNYRRTTSGRFVLLPTLVLTTDVTRGVGPLLEGLAALETMTVQATFVYGGTVSGNPNVTAWVQTSLDGGLSFCDIMCFRYTGAAGRKISNVKMARDAGLAAQVPQDGELNADTIRDGILGESFRAIYAVTGVYAPGTTLTLYAVVTG